jgi:hypothetical protein
MDAYEYILEKAREKADKYPVYLVDTKQPMGAFGDAIVTFGALSYFVQPIGDNPYRVLIEHKAMELEPGVWVTANDVAKFYLKYKFEKLPLRARGSQLESCRTPKRYPPLLAKPGKFDGVYLDIKSAYWSILQVTGWNVDYKRDRYIRWGESVADFPFPRWKLARNSLVSIGTMGEIRQFDTRTQKFASRKAGNVYKNIMLHALVMDVLNAIGVLAVAHGARYVNTDGFILPVEREAKFMQAASGFGLRITERYRGQSEIRSVGSYRVGDHVTGHWSHPTRFSKVQLPCDLNWLQYRFGRKASRTSFVYD